MTFLSMKSRSSAYPLTLAWALLLWSALACSPQGEQRLEVVKFDALDELINRDSEQLEVINFWATWCKPCIKELPYFEELHSENESVHVTLVSLDFADEFEKKVVPFVDSRGLSADVLLLDEIDYNAWIDRVDPSWSGAIPATLLINHRTNKRRFVEKELTKEELESIISELTN
ncbi:hypothetical protein GCM10011340_07660 [Roseivirga thermotolerans]|uniref:Thioredoxin domain-containing protein n=2 Tax=Roseivirgaceae TaxID=2762306 RepID=A0ABQ3I1Y2_9BACT|nr:hypothetical protein GCM10011340_07660 [Roseivirga thermotolerans]